MNKVKNSEKIVQLFNLMTKSVTFDSLLSLVDVEGIQVLIVTSTFLVDTLPFCGAGIGMAVTVSFIQTMNIVGWERAGTDAVDTLQVGVVVTDRVYTATDHRTVLGPQRTN